MPLTSDELLDRARTKAFIDAVNALASNARYTLPRVFETVGCTCHPLRGQRDKLLRERREDLAVALRDLVVNSLDDNDLDSLCHMNTRISIVVDSTALRKLVHEHPHTATIEALTQQIQKIDGAEHPTLDQEARRAEHFFKLWLMEQSPDHLTMTFEEIAKAYAKAWLFDNWRPQRKAPTEVK